MVVIIFWPQYNKKIHTLLPKENYVKDMIHLRSSLFSFLSNWLMIKLTSHKYEKVENLRFKTSFSKYLHLWLWDIIIIKSVIATNVMLLDQSE